MPVIVQRNPSTPITREAFEALFSTHAPADAESPPWQPAGDVWPPRPARPDPNGGPYAPWLPADRAWTWLVSGESDMLDDDAVVVALYGPRFGGLALLAPCGDVPDAMRPSPPRSTSVLKWFTPGLTLTARGTQGANIYQSEGGTLPVGWKQPALVEGFASPFSDSPWSTGMHRPAMRAGDVEPGSVIAYRTGPRRWSPGIVTMRVEV